MISEYFEHRGFVIQLIWIERSWKDKEPWVFHLYGVSRGEMINLWSGWQKPYASGFRFLERAKDCIDENSGLLQQILVRTLLSKIKV